MFTSGSSITSAPTTAATLTGAPAGPPAAYNVEVRHALEQTLLSRSLSREHGFEPLQLEGRLPAELRGTLLRNGPGQFEVFGRRVAHTFEADGLITAVRFDGATAVGACRFTASAGRVAEQSAGRMLHGTALPWHRRFANMLRGRQKNTANTNVVAWQGRVLALMEAARPTELTLDGADLATVGETDLGGVVGSAFSAHPHRVAVRRATYNFGVEYGRRTRLALFELPDDGPARKLGALDLGFAPMLHDFIATERHLIFFVAPAAVHVPRMLLQLGGFRELFRWQPERGTEVIVVPIDDVGGLRRFTVDAFYQWHFANAFERGGELVVDHVRYDDFGTFETLAGDGGGSKLLGGTLHRAVIDVAGGRLTSEPLSDRPVEFPRVHPEREGVPHAVTWLVADGAQTVLAQRTAARAPAAADQFRFGDHEAISEPVFVPRGAAEDDGWVLALVYDHRRERSSIAILDGQRLGDGPVARAWFDHGVPVTFHGNWLPAA